MEALVGNTRLQLFEGDITEQDTEAIVNAAHWDLLGGQGVDGAIHWKAGPQLLEVCREIGGCPIGEAVLTDAFNLPNRYIVHTVGPVYEEGDETEALLLAGAYRNSLRLAADHHIKSIAFPSLSTGAFCYPIELAAPVAMQAILDFLRDEPHQFELVRMVLYPREHASAYAVYAHALDGILNNERGLNHST